MRLVPLLVLLPAAALAQTTTGLSLQIQGQSSQTVSGSQCDVVTQLTWTVSTTGVPCGDLVLWATTSNCGDAPDGGDFQIADIAQATWSTQTTGTEDVTISDLPLGTDGGTCGAAVETTVNLCGALKIGDTFLGCSGTPQVLRSSPATTIVYDAVPPDVPTISEVGSLDGALRVSVGVPSDATAVNLEFRQQGTSTWLNGGSVAPGEGGLTLDGLTDGVTYEVRANAADAAGNKSDFSDIKTGTPQQTEGFWATYKKDGGAETGGCSATGAGGLLGGLVLLLGLVWRKK